MRIKFGPQLNLILSMEDVKMGHSNAVKQLYLGEMIDREKTALDRLELKIEKIKARIDVLEEKRSEK